MCVSQHYRFTKTVGNQGNMSAQKGGTMTRSENTSVNPILPEGAIAKLRSLGQAREVAVGEVVVSQGKPMVSFIVVESGNLSVDVRSHVGVSHLGDHIPGQFFGDVDLLSGRPSVISARVTEAGTFLFVPRTELKQLMAADTQLGELLLRTFILRRVELLANGHADGIVVGSRNSVGTLRIREFLTRNGYPHAFLDLDRDKEVQSTMDAFNLILEDIPVLILRGQEVLRNPSDAEIAAYLGLNASVDAEEIRDVAIVGAGPAGLSAAVYAASEGLSAILLETKAPGGQAGSSSKIENYLGFPTGISGLELASRAYTQSQKFGAELLIARSAVQLSCSGQPYELKTSENTSVRCSAVVIATGAQYRKLQLPNLEAFEGVGVYYGATAIEAQACGDENVIVVGGGNSAGQAAVFLSQSVRHVHILIRRGNLADTMSRYLVQRIEQSPKITLHPYTEIVELRGGGHLESVVVHDSSTATDTAWNIRHVYLMTGASPNTDWLRGCVVLDDKGFVKTGPDLSPQELSEANWPLQRRPHLLETSLPGVFAVGDVRSGSVKRVASGVGEGSLSVHFVHLALAEG